MFLHSGSSPAIVWLRSILFHTSVVYCAMLTSMFSFCITQVRLPILVAISPLNSSKSSRNSLKSSSVGCRSPSACLLLRLLPQRLFQAFRLSCELELLKGLLELEEERKGL